jgi:hypothetical protein
MVSPLWIKVWIRRMLKFVKCPAEQVAVQLPHPIQSRMEGSIEFMNRVISWSFASKSICRSLVIVYPNDFMQSSF